MKGKEMKMQPTLIHVPIKKDVVYTPDWIARDMVYEFARPGIILDPCLGDGAFYKYMPDGARRWCEIEQGFDFYAWNEQVTCIIGNPPYSNLLAWIRHSFKIAMNISYLLPLHRIFSSNEFLDDLYKWGGVRHIRRYGTGTNAGFPFGHALAAVHFVKDYSGPTLWSRFENKEVM